MKVLQAKPMSLALKKVLIAILWEGTQNCYIEIIYANDTQLNNEPAWRFNFTVNAGITWPRNAENTQKTRWVLEKPQLLFMFVSQYVQLVSYLLQANVA